MQIYASTRKKEHRYLRRSIGLHDFFLLSEFTFPSVVSEEVNSQFSDVFAFNPAMSVRTRIEIGLESTYLENRNSSKNLTP